MSCLKFDVISRSLAEEPSGGSGDGRGVEIGEEAEIVRCLPHDAFDFGPVRIAPYPEGTGRFGTARSACARLVRGFPPCLAQGRVETGRLQAIVFRFAPIGVVIRRRW